MMLAPVHDGQVIPPDEFRRLPQAEQERIRADIEDLQGRVEKILQQIPQWEREVRAQLRQLGQDVTTSAVRHLIDELRAAYQDLPAVLEHLRAIERDLMETADQFVGGPVPHGAEVGAAPARDADRFRRYWVNLLVDHSASQGAPVVCEDHPAFQNLVGRIEYIAQLGALVTDFNLIKPGALHRANGGYVVLDARRVLLQPFAWEELKRVLRAREIRIESLAQTLSLISTVTLEPESIPLNLKVVLVGDRLLYYLLCALDPDFAELFKVPVDFADDVGRTADTAQQFARLLATIAARDGLRPLTRDGVARVIERASRLVDDATKLSIHERTIGDLLREADYFAGGNAHDSLGRGEVVDIEREVAFGGPIHAKGVLILAGFLGARFAADRPLTLHASLVFEQSYGPVEGDSASAAELYALLSALAEVPIKQSFAVTGSVNQHGQAKPLAASTKKSRASSTCVTRVASPATRASSSRAPTSSI